MSTLAIAGREMRSLFLSPLAWSLLAVVQLISALLFLNGLEEYSNVQHQLSLQANSPGITTLVLAPLYASAAFIVLLTAPLITMRLISEERRAGTLPLLLSAPVSMGEIVLGKFLAAWGFFALMLVLISLMPLSLLGSSQLDGGLLAASLLAALLALGAFAAAGLYLSCVSEQPAVAAVAGFGLLLLLWIIDSIGDSPLFAWLSLHRHFKTLASGLVDSGDLLYFLLFITLFLLLAVRRLEAERLQRSG